ncbi:MAG: hypothetical protein WCI41_02150, partial [bacterium]
MDTQQEILKRLIEQDAKIDAIYKSVEKTRKYFVMIMWVTVIAVVLPLIGLMFAIPAFLGNYANTLGGLG